MASEIRVERLEAVADAVRKCRVAMEHYIHAQARLLDDGVTLDEVTQRNWEAFEATMRAEEGVYAALDTLDALDTPFDFIVGREGR